MQSADLLMSNVPTYPTLAEALKKLVGCALSSVTFVADYVQFAFNGPGLTAYTSPIVRVGSQLFEWGQPGYRDALCGQIDHRVERVEIDNHHVAIFFECSSAISISLLDKDYVGPEALEFSLNEEQMWVV
jgi:hypothetical protein